MTGARWHPTVRFGSYQITDREFRLFQALIQQEAGIQIPEAKRALLVGRLSRRLRELGLDSFGAYYERIREGGDEAERTRMLDLMSTNETHFFREPSQFEFLERQLLPAWIEQAEQGRRPRRARVWSAACSTGEEPYSIAMVLLAHLPGWQIDVLGTDLSTRVLETARAGLWPIGQAHEIPERHLKAFMLRGTGEHEGVMKAGADLRDAVRFEHLNLHGAHYAVAGPFDVIFCRNVLIYFDVEGRAAIVRKLLERLAPDGHFFLGHAETLNGLTDRLQRVGPAAYSWSGTPGRTPALAESKRVSDTPSHQIGDEP